jgi:hypothetical protein
VSEPTVAVAVLLLLHVPPVVVLVSEIAAPSQTVAGPVMAAGSGLTVSSADEAQPVALMV